MIVPQGTTEFIAMRGAGSTTDNTLSTFASPHRISGTNITSGLTTGALSELGATASTGSGETFAVRLTTGVYIIGMGANNSGPMALAVMKSNGDAINYLGAIRMPRIRSANFSKKLDVSSSRIIVLAISEASTINAAVTFQMRLLNVEIAS